MGDVHYFGEKPTEDLVDHPIRFKKISKWPDRPGAIWSSAEGNAYFYRRSTQLHPVRVREGKGEKEEPLNTGFEKVNLLVLLSRELISAG